MRFVFYKFRGIFVTTWHRFGVINYSSQESIASNQSKYVSVVPIRFFPTFSLKLLYFYIYSWNLSHEQRRRNNLLHKVVVTWRGYGWSWQWSPHVHLVACREGLYLPHPLPRHDFKDLFLKDLLLFCVFSLFYLSDLNILRNIFLIELDYQGCKVAKNQAMI